MLLDDNKFTLKNLQRALQMHGFETVAYLDPVAAIDSYSDHNFPIIICDYHMPYLNGLEAIKILQSFNSDARCILYSGYPEEKLIEEINKTRIKFFFKPFKFQKLMAYLEKVIDEIDKNTRETNKIKKPSNPDAPQHPGPLLKKIVI